MVENIQQGGKERGFSFIITVFLYFHLMIQVVPSNPF